MMVDAAAIPSEFRDGRTHALAVMFDGETTTLHIDDKRIG
jgi:hypothetical protein